MKIGVIDTGVETTHDDLSGKSSGDLPESYPYDDYAHGTHVAGIAAAKHNNIGKVRGVDANVQVISKKVFSGYHYDPYDNRDVPSWAGDNNAYNKIVEAVNSGANILNNSYGGSSFSTTLRLAFSYAYKMNRSSVVSMGNGNTNSPRYPAAFGQGIIAVGATNKDDVRWEWNTYQGSNYGNHIDVTAPGDLILSTWRGNDYNTITGTSMATPIVAGVATLLKGYNPNLFNDDIENIIKLSPDKVGSDPYNADGWNDKMGYGRVNAKKALDFLRVPYTLTQSTASGGNISQTVDHQGIFYGIPGNAPDGYYVGKKHEVRKRVYFSPSVSPWVWGRGVSTVGYANTNSGSTNFTMGYCEIAPGTLTSSSVELRTWVYKISLTNGAYYDWYPCSPENVNFAYTVLNIPCKLFLSSTRGAIYWGQTSTITASTNAPEQNWSYSWSTSAIPQGIEFTSNGSKAYLTNYSYKSTNSIKTPVAAIGVTCTATNQDGGVLVNTITISIISGSPGGGGGCPFVYSWNGNEYIEDNNILPQSVYTPPEEGLVTDYYQLFKEPIETDITYKLRVGEFEQEISTLDQFKLLIVDHIPEALVSVNDNGEISLYAKPASLTNANVDNDDVYKLVYEMDNNFVETEPDQSMQLTFEDEQVGSDKAMMMIASSPIKEPIGYLDKLNGKSISPQDIRLRKNMSYTWVPVNIQNHKETNIDIGINWTGTAKLDYSELSNKLNLEYILSECDLILAEHSQSGNVTDLLLDADNNTAVLNPGSYVDLVFDAPPIAEGKKRSFIFVSRGRYERISEKLSESVLIDKKAKNNLSEDNPNKPVQYELSQNRPNPFNPVTRISYALPDAAYVTLKVFDVLGREVATLVDEYKEAGYYNVSFDASSAAGVLTSGIYFYRIEATSVSDPSKSFTQVRKMILIR